MTSRSTPAIALLESNEEDGHYFMSFDSDKRINSMKWTPLPIISEVIARVDELATSSKQDVLVNNLPTFEWSRGVSIADQSIPYEVEVPVHDEGVDDPHVPIIDNPFEMVDMISDDDTDADRDIDDGFVFDGQLSEDVDAPPNAFDDESFDQGLIEIWRKWTMR